MKKFVSFMLAAAFVFGFAASPALADWTIDDGYKMHFPQMPDSVGWDVRATFPYVLADDWTCIETGWVKDIHFWGSWVNGIDGEILQFELSIHADIPANPPVTPYSRPGEELWKRVIAFPDFIIAPVEGLSWQGWYDPVTSWYNFNDHEKYYQYNVFLDSLDWFWQDAGTVYWLNISATVADPANTQWGWKSSINHHLDDAVWAEMPIYNWVDLWEPPEFLESLDLAFVITGGPDEPIGACCYPDPVNGVISLCIETTQADCINNLGGIYEGDGTACAGTEACCLTDGTCLDADALCCANELGGTPQGPSTVCTTPVACCLPDGTCIDVDPVCCDDMGGVSQGSGFACTQPEACCLSDGSCIMVDPVCCDDIGGTPQGFGTSCSANTIACCLTDGSCIDVDPLCCDDMGGTPSPYGAPACLGDANGNTIDDACEVLGACCWTDGSCTMETSADCINNGGDYKGDGTRCLGDINNDGIDDICQDLWPGHKMHYPQLPDEEGWDVFATADPNLTVNLAEDWKCTESGWVKDIHWWGSWKGGLEAPILVFALRIWSDIPASESPTGYSMPGELLWEKALSPAMTSITSPTPEGWYNPAINEVIFSDHNQYYQYDLMLDSLDWFWQEEGNIYWLSIICVHIGPEDRQWGWKSSKYHFMDDAVWGIEEVWDWIDIWEPPDYTVSLDLAFVITGGAEPTGACCYPDPGQPNPNLCVVTTQADCVNNLGGVYQGDGTSCGGIEACCLPDGGCINADALCCLNELGGTPQGSGTTCTQPEACCLATGSCIDVDPLCCDDMGGVPQGPGTACSANTIACCLTDGSCIDVDPLCCDDLGGTPSPYGAPACLGDSNGNSIDDACEVLGACCWSDGSCTMETSADCINSGGDYKGDGTHCLGDINNDGIDDICQDLWPGHKMHYPQLPDEAGWDVYATGGSALAVSLADDWKCSETGWVKDLHWWGSWKGGNEAPILFFAVRIWSDIPASESPTGYSMPGEIQWERALSPGMTSLTSPTPEGWYNPVIPEVIPDDHNRYYRYDAVLDSLDWFWQEEGTIYWLSIVCVHLGSADQEWGWKSSQYHFMDDAVWGLEDEWGWMDIWEPPDYTISLDLAFVITAGVEPTGACCYENAAGEYAFCTVTTQSNCVNDLGGVYEGDGTTCSGMEACCLPDGACIDADALCCVNELGGVPQGTGTTCTATEACCLSDGSCINVDPLCCDDMGGTPQGTGTQCATVQACCMSDGSCQNMDSLCCLTLGGIPQGTGTSCSANTAACCLTDGSCINVDPLCCDEMGGFVSPWSNVCLGDGDLNGIDDACEEPKGACCLDDGSCLVTDRNDCETVLGGRYIGDGTACLGDADGDGIDDVCETWIPGDPHKMHFPQLPDEAGWDVNATYPYVVADDFMCMKSGLITDIHLWGSWRNGNAGNITGFVLSINSNVPAGVDLPYSHPGDELWIEYIDEFGIRVIDPPTWEGWYDPIGGDVIPDDHNQYFQYDLFIPETIAFPQDSGTIYWLTVSALVEVVPTQPAWGWKSSLDHWEDDAVYGTLTEPDIWFELFEPDVPVDPIVNHFGVSVDEAGNFLEGWGENAYGDGWYFYPWYDWWNVWFYDHPFSPERHKTIVLDFEAMLMTPGAPAFLEVAVNWSTDQWSIDQPVGDSAPPLPGEDEDLYIGRATLFAEEFFEGHHILTYVIPDYNPEWVSVDVRGYNFYIPDGFIEHTCLGQQSMDMAFVITGGEVCDCIPGDANNDGAVNIGDAVYLIAYVFKGGPPPTPYRICSGDANCDCQVNVGDAVYIISYVFKNGPPPCDCPTWLSICGPPLRK